MPDNSLNLQAELKKYQAAIKQEYENAVASGAGDQSQLEEYTQEYFKKNINMAAAQIAWLAQNAESESVRMNASKYVIERALAQSAKDADPIKALLTEISNLPKPPPEA
jgi:hypothetical protein